MIPRWTILIATLGCRQAKLGRLLDQLLPQVEAAGGLVTVEALWNNGERTVARVRQDLLEHAESDYICFADDDDEVPDYYVSRVLPLLDGTDYIGWRMQAFTNGMLMLPTYHSLRYSSWYQDEMGYYRDVSHLNPVRRSLTEGTSFYADPQREATHEDLSWAEQLRPRLKTEHYIGDVPMYFYRYETRDSIQHGLDTRGDYSRPDVQSPCFSWCPARERM